MNLLIPIGLLGLLGLVALIIIYIIKPNYQNKVISSTFIWKLSLKFRKKRLPMNKLNNILLFLCQCLILTICALLLAKPVIPFEKLGNENEKVIVIDASASMLLASAEGTRFTRAVEEAREMAEATMSNGGLVSVVLANDKPSFVAQRLSGDRSEDLHAALDALVADKTGCTYGTADMEGAFALVEEVLNYNNEAQVHLYTATTYLEKNGVTVENMAVEGEWNAAVLGCTAKYNQNNHYEIAVDLGCFGRTEQLTVNVNVYDFNGKGVKKTVSKAEFFDPTEDRKTVTFTIDEFGGEAFHTFDYLEVYVEVDDSFVDDNSFFLYGGKKQTVRVQYASSMPNNFFGGVIRTLRETMKDKWNIEFVSVPGDTKGATEGFDLYIFEHRMPEEMPKDGVVLLVDPTSAPKNSGLHIGGTYGVNSDTTLASGVSHKLMEFVDPGRITIAKYNQILSSDGYEELAYYQGNPVLLAKDTPDEKVVVWAFDLNYSNLIALPDFSFLVYNLFTHFVPSTVSSNAVEVGETVDLTARGTELKLTGANIEQTFEGNSGSVLITTPGTYTITQKPMDGDALLIEYLYARIPSSESDVTKEVDALPYLSVEQTHETGYDDLLFYFAIALVAFMFAEWYLQTRKNY